MSKSNENDDKCCDVVWTPLHLRSIRHERLPPTLMNRASSALHQTTSPQNPSKSRQRSTVSAWPRGERTSGRKLNAIWGPCKYTTNAPNDRRYGENAGAVGETLETIEEQIEVSVQCDGVWMSFRCFYKQNKRYVVNRSTLRNTRLR